MKSKDVVIGMKVVPHSKSKNVHQLMDGLDGSVVWHRAKLANQSYLYVTGWDTDIKAFTLSERPYFGEPNGDYFLAREFEPYVEER